MSAKKKKASAKAKPKAKSSKSVHCCECKKAISAKGQALFVEEEVGRYFCDESCIVAHFTPEIEKLERLYGKHVSAADLSSEERERYAHLRWTTLEQPDEVWRETASSGDHRYTMISEYQPDSKPVWGVSVCLMLRGEPSFLFIAFVTGDRHLVDIFRKGEKLKVIRKNTLNDDESVEQINLSDTQQPEDRARLAEPWTESDSVRATIIRNRKPSDIPVEDFAFYQNCMEETLQEPTELWSYTPKSAKRVYHFIREYDHDQSYWYVVMARDTADDTQIEIIDAFPTKDKSLVELCKHGRREVLGSDTQMEMEDALPATGTSGKRNVH